MSKRFIDTGLFDDDWFMELSKDAKLLWVYVITKCNHAGIIKLNEKLCKVQTDIKDLNSIIKQLDNHLLTISEHLYFIPKFIEFQYPGFPNSKVRQQISAVDILVKYGLFDKENLTLIKELDNTYVNDNDNGNDTVIVNGNVKEEQKQIFDIFRKEFPGTKRGLDIEFENFTKKHKDWKEVLEILNKRLSYQKEARQARKENKLFVPEWKNLETWINKRCWEDYINTEE